MAFADDIASVGTTAAALKAAIATVRDEILVRQTAYSAAQIAGHGYPGPPQEADLVRFTQDVGRLLATELGLDLPSLQYGVYLADKGGADSALTATAFVARWQGLVAAHLPSA